MNESVTIDHWTEWTDEEIVDRHQCPTSSNLEIGILRRTDSESGPAAWILASIEPATEEDVRKGVAPELGVPSRCTALTINYCPFCGAQLDLL